MRRVITVGAATIDCLMKSSSLKVTKSHEVPGGIALCEVLGGKMEAEDGALTTGGGGTNVAVGLRRLGHSVKVLTRLGDDDLGEIIVAKLMKENVGMELLQHGKGKTGLSAILVANNGGRSIITYRGESGNIDGSLINWNEVGKAEWIQISSLGGNVHLLEDLVTYAKSKHIGVGVNPGKGELDHKEKIISLIPKVDFFVLNRMEASLLWGVDFDDERRILSKFYEAGSPMTAVTDGKRGASLIRDGMVIKMDAFPNKSIDDTGAGDAFVSGAVAAILAGMDQMNILKSGLANGGSTVMKLGAKEGLLYKNDLEKWLLKQLKSTETEIGK